MSDFFSDIPDAPKPRFDKTSPGGSFGAPRPYGGHTGADFAWNEGERVGVPRPGKVRFAGKRSGYGNRVEVEHDDGTVTTYSHLSKIDVNQGDDLDGGSLVGLVGSTGGNYGKHLHYEVLKSGRKVNPLGTDLAPVRGAAQVKLRAGFFSDVPDAITAPPPPVRPTAALPLPTPVTAEPSAADFFADLPDAQSPAPTPPVIPGEAVGTTTPNGGAAPPTIMAPPPPQPVGYLDESKETPEDFVSLQPRTPKIDPYTQAGRAQRDTRLQAEASGGALYRVPIGSGRPEEAERAGVEHLAGEIDAPPEFVRQWLKGKNLSLQFGEQSSAPTGYAVIPAEMVGQMRRDYRASLSLPARAVRNVSEVLSTRTPGEMLLGTAEELKKPVTADPVSLTEADRTELATEQEAVGGRGEYERAFTQPFEGFSAALGTKAGNVLNVIGRNLGADSVRDLGSYLQRRGEIVAQKSRMRPEGEEAHLGPELVRYGTGAGLSIAELVLLKRVSGLPLPVIMAGESLVQDADKPSEIQAQNAIQAFGSGLLLEKTGALGRVASTVAQGGLDVGQSVLAGDPVQTTVAKGVGGALLGLGMSGKPEGEQAMMREAIKPEGDARVLGDLTRRSVPETRAEDLNVTVPVNEGLTTPRVVKPELRSQSPRAETATPEAVPVTERAATATQASNGPVVETIIKHSNPRIDGGKVVGQTSDGKLKVENNEGGVSVVQHPRKQGNREATLIRREVQTGAEEVRGDTRPDEVGGQVGQGGEDLGGENLQQPTQAGAEARVRQERQVTDGRAQAPDRAEVQGVEADGRGTVAAPEPPPVGIARPADAVAAAAAGASREAPPDRLTAPAPPKGPDFGKGLTRSYQAGQNRAGLTFDSLEQRDLFDLTSKGSDNISLQEKQRRAARKEQVRDDLAQRLGISPEEVMSRAFDVRNDVRAQMKGVGDGEVRALADNVLKTRKAPALDAPVPKVAAPSRLDAPVPGPRAFRAQMKTKFNLSDAQADAVTAIADARANAWAKENGKQASDYYVERFGGIERGGEAGKGALNQAATDAPTFYSQAQKVVEGIRQERMQPAQLKAMLDKGGVKAEEFKWSGLDDYLREKAAKGEPVTKSEALEFLRQNEVKVEEVVKGGPRTLTWKEDGHGNYDSSDGHGGIWEINQRGDTYGVYHNGGFKEAGLSLDEAKAYVQENAKSDTKFGTYTLPGAKEGSYRELLLTLPEIKREETLLPSKSPVEVRSVGGREQEFYLVDARGEWGTVQYPTREAAERALAEQRGAPQRIAVPDERRNYYSSHYDEPNILAHVRFNERTDAEGKRVLFVEEIQSDWHQAGRKKGYVTDTLDQKPLVATLSDNGGYYEVTTADGEFVSNVVRSEGGTSPDAAIAEARRRLREQPHRTARDERVPDAPFKKNWHELSMKRILRHAAENGYDRVAWTKGEQQAARYDLSKQVKRVSYNYDTKQLTAVDLQGNNVLSKEVAPGNLEDYVGKEVAQKFADAQSAGRKFVSLTGEDLKVGGEGMKGFYDKILPSFAAKYGRKWGARVGETKVVDPQTAQALKANGKRFSIFKDGRRVDSFDTREEAVKALDDRRGDELRDAGEVHGNVAHSIDITPEMKRSVLSEGQPLFQQNKAAVEFMSDGRAVLRAFQKADVSSAWHEMAHVFRRDLPENLLRDAEDSIGVKDGKWERDHEEKFARGFERYLKTGEAPTVKLRRVFEAAKQWLTEIYGAVRGKNHPLNFKPNEKLTATFDRMLGGEAKGEYGQLIHQLHKAPSEGTPAFFENAQVKRSLGLKPDASTADVRASLTEAVGKPRSSHLSPEDVTKWADSKGLQGAAREALEFATGKYKETVRQPTEYEQTGIRKRNVNPETQSLAEFVRAMGGIRHDRDRANRGELESLSNKESGSSGLYRRDGMSVHDMAKAAAEAGYPVGSEGGYVRQSDTMKLNAGAEGASADMLVEMLGRDLGGDKVYSHLREIDYEEMYRQENPDDSADALISLVETERGGILFDKVQDGTATRRETQEFRELARDGGVSDLHVREVLARGKAAKAAGVQDSARSQPEDDFNFGDDPVDDGDKPSWFYQSDHKPQQLGFVNEGLTQQDARRGESRPTLDDAKTDAAKRALGTEGYARLSELKASSVGRMAVEVERRVNAGNSQNAPDVVAALSKLAELKRTKQAVDDYLNQGSLFGERELTPAQERILSALDRNPRKVIEEAFPEEQKPTQDTLFQADNASASRRQRAYRALLEARGQGSLSPDLRTNPQSRTRMGAGRAISEGQPELIEGAASPRKATFKEQLADVANAPRSLKSSIDLSASMRQGAMFTLTHPFRASRIFFGQQLKSLSFKGYEDFVAKLKADPDVKQMKDAGLHLTSLADDKISLREEAFASKLAGKVPFVKRSENAYVTFLDAARSQWFKQLKTQAEDAAKAAGKPVTGEQYQSIARFVNRATGRGDLGKGAVNDAAPLLNSIFFAPRYAVSKVQVFDPRTYSRLPPGARRMAVRQAVQYFGTVAATALLLKYGLGAQVGTDPEQSDFLKVRLGNTRYDLAAGSAQYVTLAARLARNIANRANGTKDEQFKGLEDNVTRFLRYKLAPVPAAALNAYQKRDAVGQKTDAPKEALGLITPIYLTDLYEAFRQEGVVGLGKTAPGFVGVGVQTYSDERKGGIVVPPPPAKKNSRKSGGAY